MQTSEFKQFSEMLQAAADLYGKPLSDGAVTMWWGIMRQYDLQQVSRALSLHCASTDQSGTFMPKPADLIRLIEGSTNEQAQAAWAKFDKTFRSVGPYRTVCFDDPLIHAVVSEMGGWASFANKTDEDWPFVAREFESRYAGHKRQKTTPNYPAKLTGLADLSNSGKGYAPEPVMLIGDAAKANAVLANGSGKPAVMVTAAEMLKLK